MHFHFILCYECVCYNAECIIVHHTLIYKNKISAKFVYCYQLIDYYDDLRLNVHLSLFHFTSFGWNAALTFIGRNHETRTTLSWTIKVV